MRLRILPFAHSKRSILYARPPPRYGDILGMNGLAAVPNLSRGRLRYETLLVNGEGTQIRDIASSRLWIEIRKGFPADSKNH